MPFFNCILVELLYLFGKIKWVPAFTRSSNKDKESIVPPKYFFSFAFLTLRFALQN